LMCSRTPPGRSSQGRGRSSVSVRRPRISASTALRGRGATALVRDGSRAPGGWAPGRSRTAPSGSGRPGRSHSGSLISKDRASPRQSVAGDAGRSRPAPAPIPAGTGAGRGEGPPGLRGGEPAPSAREGMAIVTAPCRRVGSRSGGTGRGPQDPRRSDRSPRDDPEGMPRVLNGWSDGRCA
jgi:hypothetical protein